MFKLGSNYIRFDKKINSSFFIKVYSQKSSVIKIEQSLPFISIDTIFKC